MSRLGAPVSRTECLCFCRQSLTLWLAVSGWLMMRSDADKWATKEGIKAPIFWGHGSSDQVVAFDNQKHGVDVLKKLGCTVTTAVYKGVGHSLGAASLGHIQRFFGDAVKGTVENKEL
mmetsp:Transcript_33431/g.78355  ORF Transcript_33431/g.78355 Transcript_33431/m.78355 type:complete len:118 (-) Transcript_33431:1411-1764(-)